MAALSPIEEAKAARKVLAWQDGLKRHIEAVNRQRRGSGFPEMKRQRGREQVVFAPDAVRAPREAAGSRRRILAADKTSPPWAEPTLRATVPNDLQDMLDGRKVVHVSKNVAQKIDDKHGADRAYLQKLTEVLAKWQYAGGSPKGSGKKEVYSLVEGVWITTVVATLEDVPEAGVLVTIHRLKAKKVANRVAQGYLQKKS